MKFPIKILVLDLVGTLMLGISLFDANLHTGIIPDSLQFRFDNIVLAFAGILLMLPFLIHLIRQVKHREAIECSEYAMKLDE